MAHGKGTLAFEEGIVSKSILARFTGDDLKLSTAPFKVVVLYYRIGVRQGIVAGTYPEGFSSVGTQGRAITKVVVVDEVMVFTISFVLHANSERHPSIPFSNEVVVVEAVVFTVNFHPVVGVEAFGGIVVIDNTLGHPAIIAGRFLVHLEGDHGTCWRKSVAEYKPF